MIDLWHCGWRNHGTHSFVTTRLFCDLRILKVSTKYATLQTSTQQTRRQFVIWQWRIGARHGCWSGRIWHGLKNTYYSFFEKLGTRFNPTYLCGTSKGNVFCLIFFSGMEVLRNLFYGFYYMFLEMEIATELTSNTFPHLKTRRVSGWLYLQRSRFCVTDKTSETQSLPRSVMCKKTSTASCALRERSKMRQALRWSSIRYGPWRNHPPRWTAYKHLKL